MTNPVPLIDKPNAKPGDLDTLTSRLDGDSAEKPAPQNDRIPAKFKGKSLEDVIESYVNLEQRFGQLGNDHGTLRNRVDQMLELKRADDLRSGSPATPDRKKIAVSPSEIIENPSDVLSHVQEETLNEADSRMNARVSELEASLKAERFASKHPDFVELNNSAAFINWVQASKSRQRVAAIARDNRDYDLADELLTEYKSQSQQNKQHATQDNYDGPGEKSNVDRARAASLESSSAAASPAKSGERYRRSDLIQLKVTNPKKYAALGDKITRAYIENRVDD